MSAVPPDLWLSLSAQALSILPLGLMGLLGINLGALVLLRLRRPSIDAGPSGPQAPELELEPTDDWPSVLIQIPIFNEGLLVRPCLEAVADLDYPSIQLDWTTATTARLRAIARSPRMSRPGADDASR